MEAFRLLFLLLVFFQDSSSNDILAKFHQNAYKIRNIRIELVHYDKNYYDIFEVKPFKYNRTTAAHNGTIRFKVDVQDKIETLVQFNKFMSNEYRHFPVRYQVSLKKSFDQNVIGLQDMLNCGNMTFNFKKDTTYYFCNMVPDEKHFPPLVPNGVYRIDGELLYLDKSTSLLYFYFEIYTPMDYPKK